MKCGRREKRGRRRREGSHEEIYTASDKRVSDVEEGEKWAALADKVGVGEVYYGTTM